MNEMELILLGFLAGIIASPLLFSENLNLWLKGKK